MHAMSSGSARDRRRVQRVWLLDPLRATAGSLDVLVTDLSRSGVGVAHKQALPYVGEPIVLTVDWNGRPIDLHCEVRRTSLPAHHRGPFHSGLAILFSDTMSSAALREFIEEHIRRELPAARRKRERARVRT
jgi:hypothetical protein